MSRFTVQFGRIAILFLEGSENRHKTAEALRISWDEMNFSNTYGIINMKVYPGNTLRNGIFEQLTSDIKKGLISNITII